MLAASGASPRTQIEAVLAGEVDELASAQEAPVRFCDAPSLQHSAANLGPSFNSLIRLQQQRLRDGETERLLGVPAVAIPVAALLA